MIGITKLLCGAVTASDPLRYGRDSSKMPAELLRYSKDKKPIVVWNMTRKCNLHCIHCYIEAKDNPDPEEISTQEARIFIDDLAEFGAPVLLFSGGEPLIREDLFELGKYAADKGIRTVISTNGTLITKDAARRIKEAGFSYVGVSIDGIGDTNDKFRGKKGAFQEAIEGIKNCRKADVKVGLRFTINKHNFKDLEDTMNLMPSEDIPRCCIYHLVYAGRGSKMKEQDLTHEETRNSVDLIFRKAKEFYKKGLPYEILTVDNHTDGVYLYQTILKEEPERAREVHQLLEWNGGNSSGIGIACVGNQGSVYADQFWRHHSFGNIRKRKFSEIWMDTSDPLMAGLKDRKKLLKGRCGACKFLNLCNGNFRVRAEAIYDDVWAPDPACYLSDKEIGIEEEVENAVSLFTAETPEKK
ncbi:MAG: radical SAM protein [Firmicutes bacterium]|nr:radical SAM protein [Bacillota bacterium]